jgi:hypothetical protein
MSDVDEKAGSRLSKGATTIAQSTDEEEILCDCTRVTVIFARWIGLFVGLFFFVFSILDQADLEPFPNGQFNLNAKCLIDGFSNNDIK